MPVTPPGGEQVCLTLNNVSFSYGASTVIEDVSLTIRQEELVGIAGPNGSGKSTLMKIMVGLLKPDKGTVAFTCHIDECEGNTPCRRTHSSGRNNSPSPPARSLRWELLARSAFSGA